MDVINPLTSEIKTTNDISDGTNIVRVPDILLNPRVGEEIKNYDDYISSKIDFPGGPEIFLPETHLENRKTTKSRTSKLNNPFKRKNHIGEIDIPWGHIRHGDAQLKRLEIDNPFFGLYQGRRFRTDAAELKAGIDRLSSSEEYKTTIIHGTDQVTSDQIIIKLLGEKAIGDIDDFSQEAILPARVPYHKYIAKVLDYTYLPANNHLNKNKRVIPAVIMEYVPGQDLGRAVEAFYRAFPADPSRPNELFGRDYVINTAISQLAEGLDHLHTHNIYHNDVKTNNAIMFIDKDGQLVTKLIDFGGVTSKDYPRPIYPVTALFASPEEIHRDFTSSTDEKSDQHALAITAYNLLAGIDRITAFSPPNDNVASNAFNLYPGHYTADQRLLAHENIPREVYDVLVKATSYDPQDRYDTCVEFAQALKEAQIAALAAI